MKNGEISDLSKKIYRNHKALLETLFEFREDSISYMRTFFEKKVEEKGWVLGSSGRGFVRFLTPKLDAIIPKRKGGWGNKHESFLFEIAYNKKGSKKLAFYCTISPGDDEARTVLSRAFNTIITNNKQDGKNWMVYYYKEYAFNVNDWAAKPLEEIEEFINKLWIDVEKTVSTVENGLLKYEKELTSVKNKLI